MLVQHLTTICDYHIHPAPAHASRMCTCVCACVPMCVYASAHPCRTAGPIQFPVRHCLGHTYACARVCVHACTQSWCTPHACEICGDPDRSQACCCAGGNRHHAAVQEATGIMLLCRRQQIERTRSSKMWQQSASLHRYRIRWVDDG